MSTPGRLHSGLHEYVVTCNWVRLGAMRGERHGGDEQVFRRRMGHVLKVLEWMFRGI